jgi:hypothetical protein
LSREVRVSESGSHGGRAKRNPSLSWDRIRDPFVFVDDLGKRIEPVCNLSVNGEIVFGSYVTAVTLQTNSHQSFWEFQIELNVMNQAVQLSQGVQFV